MATLMINKKPVLKAPSAEFTAPATRKPKLVAKWFKIDGKLICQWFPADD